MASIHDLTPELLTLCFEQLYEDGRPLIPLRCLNLTCHSFYNIASKLLFRNINFAFLGRYDNAGNDSAALLGFLHKTEHVRAHVRSISVLCDPLTAFLPDSQGSVQYTLERLLPILPRLQHVRYVVIVRTPATLGLLHEFSLLLTCLELLQSEWAGFIPNSNLSAIL